jgi:hypothetical protein
MLGSAERPGGAGERFGASLRQPRRRRRHAALVEIENRSTHGGEDNSAGTASATGATHFFAGAPPTWRMAELAGFVTRPLHNREPAETCVTELHAIPQSDPSSCCDVHFSQSPHADPSDHARP